MNKSLTVVLGAAAAVVVTAGGVLAAAFAQPDVLEVNRSLTMQAGAVDAVPHLVDFEKFAKWSPWSARDPRPDLTFSAPPRGERAWLRWKGNDEAGEGEVRVKEVSRSRVVLALSVVEPVRTRATLFFTLTEDGDAVTVDWGHKQRRDLWAKARGLFADPEAALAADCEEGLERLKRVVEDDAAKRRTAAAAQSRAVTLRGSFVYKGEAAGVRRLLVRSESGDIVAARKLSGKSWEATVPRSVGPVQVHAFVDRDRDGPTAGDPGALSPVLSLAEGTPDPLVLRVRDDFDGTVAVAP